jgi:cyclase
MNHQGSFIIFLICIYLYSFSGCRSKQNCLDNIDSQEVDSLIKVQKINDRTIMVTFGYDAITAIKTDHGIVVIDAGISTALTAKYRKTIENEFHENDFSYIINSHWHHDHIGGNSIFPQAKVLGHENWQLEVSKRDSNHSKQLLSISKIVKDYESQLQKSVPNSAEWIDIFTQKVRYKSAYCDLKNNVSVKLPDITFRDSMKLELGNTTFEMIYFGKFHSISDILIYVPEIKIIFVGDLFSKYGRPSINDSSITDVERYMRAIRWIETRMHNIEKVIGSHSQILAIDDLKQFNNTILNKYSKH